LTRWSVLAALVAGSSSLVAPAAAQPLFGAGFETVCEWSAWSPLDPSLAGCLIAGVCYLPGAGNPAQSCEACVPATSWTSWTALGEGAPCSTGNVCLAGETCALGSCGGGIPASGPCDDGDVCTLGDACSGGSCSGAPDSCDDAVTCTIDQCIAPLGCEHTPSHAACADSLSCTLDSCDATLDCQHQLVSTSCLIDGACRSDGERQPGNACRACVPSQSQAAWSDLPAPTVCAPASCSGDLSLPADLCDGNGNCGDAGSVACAPYSCNPGDGACYASCATDAQCASGDFCAAESICSAPLGQGGVCTADSQCQSGSCLQAQNDRRCAAAGLGCGLDCQVVNDAGTACVDAALDTDPKDACALQPASTCGTTGVCGGGSTCAFHPPSVICAASSCSGDSVLLADHCNGTGACIDSGSSSCAPYTCNSGSGACFTSCTTAASCAAGHFCVTATSSCSAPMGPGNVCTADAQCQSGSCLQSQNDRRCAAVGLSCSLECQVLSDDGASCVPASPGSDPKDACSPQPVSSCGRTGVCGGGDTCALYPASTICHVASCSGPDSLPADRCNGNGTCVDEPLLQCDPYSCNAGTGNCYTSCVDDDQCQVATCSAGQCIP
jgi:hypothetical protein